jgi:hypothetical protein
VSISNRWRLVGVAACALVLAVGTIAHNRAGDELGAIGRLLDAIQWPAIVVGMAVSGNAHAPSEWAVYLTLFLMYFAVLAALLWAVRMAAGRKRAN